MTTLRAHFDGRVLVPVSVQEAVESPEAQAGVTYFDINPETGLPVFRVPKGTKTLSAEAIREAMDEFP